MVNALQFFAITEKNRDEYIVDDFPEVSFHGSFGDFTTGNAKEAIIAIFGEIVSFGCSFDDWIEDETFERIGIEDDFKNLCGEASFANVEEVYEKWNIIKEKATSILEPHIGQV